MTSTGQVSIAKQYSETPAGRFRTDGPYSGERFRQEHLVPLFNAHDLVEVDLDGTLGYGSSFLEEAFGGLVRTEGMEADQLRKRLKINSTRRFYEDRVWSYIKEAARQKA